MEIISDSNLSFGKLNKIIENISQSTEMQAKVSKDGENIAVELGGIIDNIKKHIDSVNKEIDNLIHITNDNAAEINEASTMIKGISKQINLISGFYRSPFAFTMKSTKI